MIAKHNKLLVGVVVPFIYVMFLPLFLHAEMNNDGFLYGKIITRTGNTYIGLIRWGDEEVFWDDHFNSVKEELPYQEYMQKDMEERHNEYQNKAEELYRQGKDLRKEFYNLLGGAIKVDWYNGGSRQFIARFGDIKRIKVIGSEDAEVTMKNDAKYVVSGFSNDLGGTIAIKDESIGNIDLKWSKIETIDFQPTPKTVRPAGYRLFGKVVTDAGEFNGAIQWDSQECLSIDLLDGDSEDGRVALEMGKIRKIERRNRNSSWVELKDGRRLLLDGTNDVDGSIRGILVEDPRYGRVKVSWDAFESLTFEEKEHSGRGYNDFKTPVKLKGAVSDISGKKYSGNIIYDLDESESWEMLNGDNFDVEYNIPFDYIQSISPRSRNASLITLRNGEKLRLESSQDVSSSNDGVLIFTDDTAKPVYLKWDEVEQIDFTW